MTHTYATAEVRHKGKWVTVPTLQVGNTEVVTTGGLLKIARVRGEEMMEQELNDPTVYCSALTHQPQQAPKADIFTFTQKLPNTSPRYFHYMEWESIAAIKLHSFARWWQGLPQETRKNVRRSIKRGVSTRVAPFDDYLIEAIRNVNDDTSVRQGTLNAYYAQSTKDTRRRYSEFLGRCDFICAYAGHEIIGFVHLVYCGDIAAILNLTVKPTQSDKRPANALVAAAVEQCVARKISYVTYGLYNYGNKHDSPLRTFKIRNGFTEILVPRYFVPLTAWGRVCITAKLHRGLVGILPHFTIVALVRTRTLWYDFIQRRCSSTDRAAES